MDWHNIARTVIKNTLEADLPYRAALVWPTYPTLTKTFGKQVHPNVDLPYVTIEHYQGGNMNNAQTDEADGLWLVAAHTTDNDENMGEFQATTLAGLINTALERKWPVMGAITGVAGFHWIEQRWPFMDTFPRQNRTYYKVGAIYRLRLAEIRSL